MKLRRLPFRFLEPALFGGLLDDPLLFLRIRPERRALLFDCGQIAHLAKRVVKPITAVFITHAHMDHIMGVPTLVRHHHASPLPLDIYGPQGVAERVNHLIMGYDWNLYEPNWFTLRVHEIHPERILHFSFPGPEGFVCRFDGEEPRSSRTVWSSRYVTVEAEILDHKIPVLAFRVTERQPFSIDPRLLQKFGLQPGDWIRDLKSRVWKGLCDSTIVVPHRVNGGIREEVEADPFALYASIQEIQQVASIGYVSDVGWNPANIRKMEEFLPGLTLLCVECTFLAADEEKARTSFHLCTLDLNELMRSFAPRYLVPMHLSKSYLRRTIDLYQELHPPAKTTVIRLPKHIVPQPLTVEDVKGWLRL